MREVPRIVPPRGRMPGGALQRQLERVVAKHPRPAVAEAEDAVLVGCEPAADDCANDRVQPGAVASAGEQSDP